MAGKGLSRAADTDGDVRSWPARTGLDLTHGGPKDGYRLMNDRG